MKGFQLLPRRPDEHVSHEECMVGSCADDPDFDPIPLIPTGKAIDNVNAISGIQVVDRAFTVDFPDLQINASSEKGAIT